MIDRHKVLKTKSKYLLLLLPLLMIFNSKCFEIAPGKVGAVCEGGVISVSEFIVSTCQN